MPPLADLSLPSRAEAAAATEWRLQSALTTRWLTKGADFDGERLYLVAWEVMTDWRINDAHRHWTLPSLDFLFLDASGLMVATELKGQIISPRDAWSALCQVTHRSHHLARSYSPPMLASARTACLSGVHGRVEAVGSIKPLVVSHMEFFQLEAPTELPGVPLRRAVAAQRFGSRWPGIRDRFTSDPGEARVALGRYTSRSNREIARFLTEEITAPPSLMLPNVGTMHVPTETDETAATVRA